MDFFSRRPRPPASSRALPADQPPGAVGRRVLRPRGEPRHTVPIFSITIRSEFSLGADRFVGQLWDISRSGACLRSFGPTPCGGRALVRLHDHAGDGVIEKMATLLWSDAVLQIHYLGLRFDQPLAAEAAFLGTLLHLS